MNQIECPECSGRFKYSEKHAGRIVPCPTCDKPLALPGTNPESIREAKPSGSTGVDSGQLTGNSNTAAASQPSARWKSPDPSDKVVMGPQNTSVTSGAPPVQKRINSVSSQHRQNSMPGADLPQSIGRFEIVSQLGAGSFGVVFRANDPVLRREVALKVPHPHLLHDEQIAKRLIQEPQAAAQLQHPNIVQVFDAGIDGSNYYVASAFIKGWPLDQLCSKKAIAREKAVKLVMKLAEALHYAHSKGIVHRDVKPANIMVDSAGEPYILDFGIARWENADVKLTEDGTMLGTPAYMSPEQAGAQVGSVGPASDQYSLGVILYELLCAQHPFSLKLNKLALMHEIRTKQPPKPSTHNPELTLDLETICLKAMSKLPADRYVNCHEMAEDLRRFLADEPIRARRMSSIERLGRWTRQNPIVASLGTAMVLIAVIGFTAVTWQWQRATANWNQLLAAQSERAQSQLDALLRAETSNVPTILESLEPYLSEVTPRIVELSARKDLSPKERLHLHLALVPTDVKVVPLLRDQLLKAEADEVLVIRRALRTHQNEVMDYYWRILEEPDVKQAQRLRAASALAAFDPESNRWSGLSQPLAEDLVRENPLHLTNWLEAFRPVRISLIAPLVAIYTDTSRRESERGLATDILAEFGSDQPTFLVELIQSADSRQFPTLMPKLKALASQVVPLLESSLDKRAKANSSADERDTLAQHQANIAVALLQLGSPSRVWPLLKHTADPSLRSYLIQRIGPLGCDPNEISQRLLNEPDTSSRHALILSLGDFGEGNSTSTTRQKLIPQLLAWYERDPDAGIHGAAEWLLRRWGQAAKLTRMERALSMNTSTTDETRGWYQTIEGHTMTVIAGPVVFQRGSPESEVNREEVEQQHRCKIGRSFAIATKEVTVAQFQRFLAANPGIEHVYVKNQSPVDDCPQTAVTWYEAAAYCNWLSKQDGLAPNEWVYPAGTLVAGMKPERTYLSRQGYRLPTEAEWEFACRANSTTSRFFSEKEALLTNDYAWTLANSHDRSWTVGLLKPNDLGIFDMLGNVWEWCGDKGRPYPVLFGFADKEDMAILKDDEDRVVRGGSFMVRSRYARAAMRNAHFPFSRASDCGFRVARTYRLKT